MQCLQDDPALRHDIAQCSARPRCVWSCCAASLSAGWWQLHDVRHETAAKCTAAAEWRGL